MRGSARLSALYVAWCDLGSAGGLVGQHFGAKRVVVVGLALMTGGGALMGISASFLMMAAGRLTSGIGAVLINVMLTKMSRACRA